MAAMTTPTHDMASAGVPSASFYCSTSGSTFSDKDAYLEHMRSDFHRYNLKRKVAGLPPVTRDWFDARKEVLLQSSATAAAAKTAGVQVWVDPLTKKKFMSENTYLVYTRSKKYTDLVKKSGAPAPAPVIITKSAEPAAQAAAVGAKEQGAGVGAFSSTYKAGRAGVKGGKGAMAGVQEEDEDADDSDGGWETASDDGDAEVTAPPPAPSPLGKGAGEVEGEVEGEEEAGTEAAEGTEGEWEEWDVCRSLFDNHVSPSLDANLEYMWKNFGFFIPDAEFLVDPAGLVQYLGAKLQYGRVPLYSRGDDPACRQFRSLHAVQRHMVDTCQCRMAYDDNEDEYAQYFDYGPDEEEEEGRELATSNAPAAAQVLGGFELMVPGEGGQGGKVLGTREFARYYRQRHRLQDTRQSVMVNTVQARYRSLGISLTDGFKSLEAKKDTQKNATELHWEGKRDVRRLVFSNFVKNLGKGVGRMY